MKRISFSKYFLNLANEQKLDYVVHQIDLDTIYKKTSHTIFTYS